MSDFVVEVVAGVNFETEFIRMIEVSLTYGDQHGAAVLDRDARAIKIGFTFDEKLGRTVQYTATAYMESKDAYFQSSQPSFEMPSKTTPSSVIVIDPRSEYRTIQAMAAAVVSFEKYSFVFVDLKADSGEGPSMTRTLELTGERAERMALFAIGRAAKLDLQHRVRHVARTGTVIEGPWEPTGDGIIVVGEPAVAGV